MLNTKISYNLCKSVCNIKITTRDHLAHIRQATLPNVEDNAGLAGLKRKPTKIHDTRACLHKQNKRGSEKTLRTDDQHLRSQTGNPAHLLK